MSCIRKVNLVKKHVHDEYREGLYLSDFECENLKHFSSFFYLSLLI